MAEDMVTRRLCKCHGEPMARNGRDRYGQNWQCRVKNNARFRRYYDRMTAEQRQRMLLRIYLSRVDSDVRKREAGL